MSVFGLRITEKLRQFFSNARNWNFFRVASFRQNLEQVKVFGFFKRGSVICAISISHINLIICCFGSKRAKKYLKT